MTNDQKCEKVAKALVKAYKQRKPEQKGKRIRIADGFSAHWVQKTKNYVTMFKLPNGKEVNFGTVAMDGSEFGDITMKIAHIISARLKLKKGQILDKEVDTHTSWGGGWCSSSRSWDVCESISIITPCKEFTTINKKLAKLGCPSIYFKDWYIDYVDGKRGDIFSHDVHYYCESEKMCKKVLDYLKGKKKVSYEYVSDNDLEEKEHADYYEIEWSGSYSKKLCFSDAKGKKTTIYGW